MELIHDYMKNDKLRHELNALAGKIVSNVSANRMCFVQNGVRKNYIQIGTVIIVFPGVFPCVRVSKFFKRS